ncbi:hypothetical protein ES703_50978 [subsurface metagenome]
MSGYIFFIGGEIFLSSGGKRVLPPPRRFFLSSCERIETDVMPAFHRARFSNIAFIISVSSSAKIDVVKRNKKMPAE